MPFHLICCSPLRRHSICWHLSLQCSTILIHHVQSIPFLGSVFDISDPLYLPASLTVYMWYSDMYLFDYDQMIIMYFPVIYTCILSGSACTWYADMLYFLWAWVCPPQTVFLSDLLLWLGRLNSGEVLLSFWKMSFPCTCLIYFGHHVPLLTSYIRGHLL